MLTFPRGEWLMAWQPPEACGLKEDLCEPEWSSGAEIPGSLNEVKRTQFREVKTNCFFLGKRQRVAIG